MKEICQELNELKAAYALQLSENERLQIENERLIERYFSEDQIAIIQEAAYSEGLAAGRENNDEF